MRSLINVATIAMQKKRAKNNSNNRLYSFSFTEMDDLVLLFDDDGKDTFDGIVGLEVEEEEDGDG